MMFCSIEITLSRTILELFIKKTKWKINLSVILATLKVCHELLISGFVTLFLIVCLSSLNEMGM